MDASNISKESDKEAIVEKDKKKIKIGLFGSSFDPPTGLFLYHFHLYLTNDDEKSLSETSLQREYEHNE